MVGCFNPGGCVALLVCRASAAPRFDSLRAFSPTLPRGWLQSSGLSQRTTQMAMMTATATRRTWIRKTITTRRICTACHVRHPMPYRPPLMTVAQPRRGSFPSPWWPVPRATGILCQPGSTATAGRGPQLRCGAAAAATDPAPTGREAADGAGGGITNLMTTKTRTAAVGALCCPSSYGMPGSG